MAKDIIDQEITVGCSVAYCLAGASISMYTAKVLRITDSRVVLDKRPEGGYQNLQRPFDAVVVIPTQSTGGEVAV